MICPDLRNFKRAFGKALLFIIVAFISLIVPDEGSAFFSKRRPGDLKQGTFHLVFTTYGQCSPTAWLQRRAADTERHNLNVNGRIIQLVGYELSSTHLSALEI